MPPLGAGNGPRSLSSVVHFRHGRALRVSALPFMAAGYGWHSGAYSIGGGIGALDSFPRA
jgi:hypothetical protein